MFLILIKSCNTWFINKSSIFFHYGTYKCHVLKCSRIMYLLLAVPCISLQCIWAAGIWLILPCARSYQYLGLGVTYWVECWGVLAVQDQVLENVSHVSVTGLLSQNSCNPAQVYHRSSQEIGTIRPVFNIVPVYLPGVKAIRNDFASCAGAWFISV